MTQDKQPSGNGNSLRDYKLTELKESDADQNKRLRKVEEAVIELKNHTRTLEDTLLEMRAQSQDQARAQAQASGMSFKWQLAILGAVLTTISGLVYALLTLPK